MEILRTKSATVVYVCVDFYDDDVTISECFCRLFLGFFCCCLLLQVN